MNIVAILLTAMGLSLLVLNFYTIRTLYSKEIYEKEQFPYLIGVILLFPFIGAGLVLYLARENYQGTTARHPSVDDDAESIGSAGDHLIESQIEDVLSD